MQTFWLLLLLGAAPAALAAGPPAVRGAAFPLESVAVEGSAILRPAILEAAGLRLAAPVSKAGIEEACRKLHETGLFASISYRYAPGPKGGYALILTLADQPVMPAVIDVPGVDEAEAWRWLSGKFGCFDRRAPEAEPAQRYLAGELERHLAGRLRGQRLTVRMETDLKTRAMTLSFQPEVLPRVRSVAFTGNTAIPSSRLAAVLNPIVADAEYTDRKFAAAVEMNLRPLYEQHGHYRVRFAPGSPEQSGDAVSLSLAIAEGAPYRLRNVEIAGDSLPLDALRSAAKLPEGKLADWRRIQEGIWDMEKLLKRRGFYEASAAPDRSFDDAACMLDLRIRMHKGPLYRFGEIRFTGLRPDLEARARQLWNARSGDPYDYGYPPEFMQEFCQSADVPNFRKHEVRARKGAGDHIVDIELVFETR